MTLRLPVPKDPPRRVDHLVGARENSIGERSQARARLELGEPAAQAAARLDLKLELTGDGRRWELRRRASHQQDKGGESRNAPHHICPSDILVRTERLSCGRLDPCIGIV
jgi:hypothetical protein